MIKQPGTNLATELCEQLGLEANEITKLQLTFHPTVKVETLAGWVVAR